MIGGLGSAGCCCPPGEGGGITEITSTAATVEVTNPAGPTTNLEANLPTERIGVGVAGHLGSNASFRYKNGAGEADVPGRPLGTFPWWIFNLTNLTQTCEGLLSFARNMVPWARIVARQSGTAAAPTSNTVAWRIVDATSVLSLFQFFDESNANGSIPLQVDVTNLDVYTGSDVELAQAAVAGFLIIPTIAADPTGVPSQPATGGAGVGASVCFNPHNGKLWIYNFLTAAWVSK